MKSEQKRFISLKNRKMKQAKTLKLNRFGIDFLICLEFLDAELQLLKRV